MEIRYLVTRRDIIHNTSFQNTPTLTPIQWDVSKNRICNLDPENESAVHRDMLSFQTHTL